MRMKSRRLTDAVPVAGSSRSIYRDVGLIDITAARAVRGRCRKVAKQPVSNGIWPHLEPPTPAAQEFRPGMKAPLARALREPS